MHMPSTTVRGASSVTGSPWEGLGPHPRVWARVPGHGQLRRESTSDARPPRRLELSPLPPVGRGRGGQANRLATRCCESLRPFGHEAPCDKVTTQVARRRRWCGERWRGIIPVGCPTDTPRAQAVIRRGSADDQMIKRLSEEYQTTIRRMIRRGHTVVRRRSDGDQTWSDGGQTDIRMGSEVVRGDQTIRDGVQMVIRRGQMRSDGGQRGSNDQRWCSGGGQTGSGVIRGRSDGDQTEIR